MTYKLATYQSADGPRAAIIVGERVIDVAKATRVKADVSVMGILGDWAKAKARLEAVSTRQGLRGQPLSKVKLLSPLPLPGAVYCAGSNYGDHAAEMARAKGLRDGKGADAVRACLKLVDTALVFEGQST